MILNVRDEEKWWNSYSETISPSPAIWRFVFTITGVRSYTFDRMIENCVFKPMAGSRAKVRDKEASIEGFKAHNEKVKTTIPADKLLVFEVKQGWEPLCKFLDCPIPEDTPFPHTNDTAMFKKFVAFRKKKALTLLAVEVALVVGGFFWVRGGKSRS